MLGAGGCSPAVGRSVRPGGCSPRAPPPGAPAGEGCSPRSLPCRLRPFTSYKLRLKATNDIGDSDFSAETEAVTTLQDGEQRGPLLPVHPEARLLERPAPALNQEGVTQGSGGSSHGRWDSISSRSQRPCTAQGRKSDFKGFQTEGRFFDWLPDPTIH